MAFKESVIPGADLSASRKLDVEDKQSEFLKEITRLLPHRQAEPGDEPVPLVGAPATCSCTQDVRCSNDHGKHR